MSDRAQHPLHVCDVAGCEEGFESMHDCITHERTHGWDEVAPFGEQDFDRVKRSMTSPPRRDRTDQRSGADQSRAGVSSGRSGVPSPPVGPDSPL